MTATVDKIIIDIRASLGIFEACLGLPPTPPPIRIDLDLAVANFDSNNVSILLGNGEGSFGPANNFGAGIGPRSIAVGDFNEDEALDIATANAGSNNISILLGNGNGTV